MTRSGSAVWLWLIMVAGLGILAAKHYAYFPGDLAVARGVQFLVPADLKWAQGVSRSAEFPWILLILGLVSACAWRLAGGRAALLALLSLGGMWALGAGLGPLVARPRPAPGLVHVLQPLAGSSCPSLFALRYAATFGFLALVAARKSAGGLRLALLAGCGAVLLLGFLARVALGAHWPSDLIISYYLGFLWAAALWRFAPLK
jgi:membrane-associated phospholipid phosphatase